ncbi:MAG: hypothetical protein QOH25_1009 [Acidobacteriota bacterium]|jgi:hypothetical protein|nr:hypothetical protein [Acidobacteriota bacterium]
MPLAFKYLRLISNFLIVRLNVRLSSNTLLGLTSRATLITPTGIAMVSRKSMVGAMEECAMAKELLPDALWARIAPLLN